MKLTVFKGLKYYLNVWLTTFKMSLSKAAVFRIEIIVRILRGVMLVAIQVIFIKAVIGTGNNIGGWNEGQMYLLSGIFNMINYISWAFFAINLWRIEEKIMKGEFDTVLLKPMSSIYSAAFPDFFIDEALTALSGIFLVIYYIYLNWGHISMLSIIYSLVATLSALVIWFSLELIFASFDFIAIKNGLREIKKNLTNVGRFPMEIWSPTSQFIFYALFPIAFVSAVPAGLLAGIYSWKFVLYSIIVASVILYLARKFWYFALQKYAGQGGN